MKKVLFSNVNHVIVFDENEPVSTLKKTKKNIWLWLGVISILLCIIYFLKPTS
jgi:hypothetical protein